MKKQHPGNVQLMREAIDLAFGPGGTPPELKMSDSATRLFYKEHKDLLAGPMQSAIAQHYDIGDGSVFVPKRIQNLFMGADWALSEAAAARAEREDAVFAGWENAFLASKKEMR